MLWTDNNTIGGIDPSEGIQLKEIDRQGIFLMIFHQWRICMLQFKISHGWCYKKRRCWFSRGHSQIWGITSLLIIVQSVVVVIQNYKYIKSSVHNSLFIYSIHCFRLFTNMEEYIVILIVWDKNHFQKLFKEVLSAMTAVRCTFSMECLECQLNQVFSSLPWTLWNLTLIEIPATRTDGCLQRQGQCSSVQSS